MLRTRVCHLKKVGGKERAEKELNSGEEKSSSDEEETIFDEEETIFDENANLEESGEKKNLNEDFVEKGYNCEENASSNLDKSTEKRKTTQEPDEGKVQLKKVQKKNQMLPKLQDQSWTEVAKRKSQHQEKGNPKKSLRKSLHWTRMLYTSMAPTIK